MTSLRRAIARYAAWLDARAARHASFAVILTAIAHRLRHILDNTEEPETETQYGIRDGATIRRIDTLDGLPAGTTLYTRTATYGPWKELR